MLLFYKLEQPQPLVNNDCILPNPICDKLSEIYQNWFPTLLVESFLTVEMIKKQKILTKESSSKFECDTLTNKDFLNHW